MPTAKLYDGEQDFNEFVLHCASVLDRHGLTLTAKLAKTQKCPKWCAARTPTGIAGHTDHNHGPQYRVVIRRRAAEFLVERGVCDACNFCMLPLSISFNYWRTPKSPQDLSYHMIVPPSVEVLAWLSDTVRCMEPMAAVDEHVAARAHRFFTDAELRELGELK